MHLHGDGSPGARPGSSGKDGSDGETAPRASAWHPLDARLGLPGLPQSGTGQTSLLTGVNAAALLGEHHGPYPGPRLRPLLETQSLWRSLSARDLPVAFANAFPERYLARVGPERGRMGAFARSALLAGVRLRGPDDLRAGRGLSAFLDNRGWREQLGYADIPRIDEAEAGRRLADLARGHALTIFEHYATDIAGHHPERLDPVAVLEALDRFLGGVLEGWADDDLLIVCSDHGNLEDARVRRHTRNPALGIWRGPAADRPLRSLTDLAPAILNMLDAGSRESGPDHNPRTRYP
ncbi:MAG: peptidase [Caldilineae bacterium]|nr:peptidase [Caldilineae bacterium]